MKTAEMSFSKTCVNFGHCYGKQGLAEAVEKQIFPIVPGVSAPRCS